VPLVKAMKVGVAIYRPWRRGADGQVSGQIPNDSRGVSDDRLDPWTQRYAEGIRKLVAYAAERGYTAADAATAWVRSHPAITSPIVGISRIEQLEET
jgi:aryl-alcohol dehydrogenase-like predicted oxidoreductase